MSRREWVERWSLRALWGFVLMAVAGFATFGVNPALLGRIPSVAWVYGHAFRFFATGQVWLAWGILALVLTLRVRTAWLVTFAAIYLLSLSSELAGTSFGFPFGAYEYTSLMEPKWLGLVPIVIPLSWFYMAIASYALAGRVAGRGRGWRWRRVVGAAAALTAWDLALDPAMSAATRYWVWEVAGPYYGMPWVNLLGWFATGMVLMGALALLRTERWLDTLPVGWMASFYLANLALPIGMNAAAGLWWAALAGVGVFGVGAWLMVRSGVGHRSGLRIAEHELSSGAGAVR